MPDTDTPLHERYTGNIMIAENIFKAYDIRGIFPDEIDEEACYRIAQAYAKFLNPKKVVLGRDVRTSGPALFAAVAQGLLDHGVDVIDIGVVTTDTMYFAAANYPVDGGITVSASHNPKEYNGLKMVRKGALPISGDTGINDIKKLVVEGYSYLAPEKGTLRTMDVLEDYLAKCLSFIDVTALAPLKVVANGMNGPAVQNVMRAKLPILLVTMNETLDGTFPKGQPDPMQEKNRAETMAMIGSVKPHLGAAWDADADRFFLFDETGRFIPGYYLTAFLGARFAARYPGAAVLHDARLTWAIEDSVRDVGGRTVSTKAGHSFIKERMRNEDAVFAGEMSGHFYFKDFFYCDNGLIPFLLMLEIASTAGKKVSELFDPYFEKYPISGEINLKLSPDRPVAAILEAVEAKHKDAKIEKIDGLSIEYPTWRANLRGSNTEPLLRLNLEARDRTTLERELPLIQREIAGG
jgi:phosphomannomutase